MQTVPPVTMMQRLVLRAVLVVDAKKEMGVEIETELEVPKVEAEAEAET